MKQVIQKNRVLFWLGFIHLLIFIVILSYSPFNSTKVLGINSLIKPMKFALSIWIYSWTMALILNYVKDRRQVKTYSWVAVVAMCFEQVAITFQAINGRLSHFNNADISGVIIFALMGFFILTITLWTAYITYIFIEQRNYDLPSAVVLSIKIGLIYFVLFSLLGGYISSLQGHTVGAGDGGRGLWFLNWSRLYGDLRVAHFFGIHSLQLIPLFALAVSRQVNQAKAVRAVKLFSFLYLVFILFTLFQALSGLPFFK